MIYRFSGGLSIAYKLEAEIFTGRKTSRVFFKGSKNVGHELERIVDLNPPRAGTPTHKCQDHVVYVDVSYKMCNKLPSSCLY